MTEVVLALSAENFSAVNDAGVKIRRAGVKSGVRN